MKVVFYHRHITEGHHQHAYYATDCCYVPEWNLVVGRESSGSFVEAEPFVSEHEQILAEAKLVAEGKWENKKPVGGVDQSPQITLVETCDVDEKLLQETVIQCRAMKTHRELAETYTTRLFKETPRTPE